MRALTILFVSMLLTGLPMARAEIITHIPTNDKVVALTFDACEAGERMSFDRAILDYLVARRIPFTVFASGKFVESNLEDIRTLATLDFVEIENHSWNHPNTMDQFSPDAVVDQLQRANEAITMATGRTPQFFRFPAGNYNVEGLRAIEAMGFKVVHWRWATGDPDPHESAAALINRVKTNVAPGDILIFHINGRGVHTAEALPRIAEQLEADGYRFTRLSDYLGTPRRRNEPAPLTSAARDAIEHLLARAPLLSFSGALN